MYRVKKKNDFPDLTSAGECNLNEFEFVFELDLVKLITRADVAHQPLTSQYHSAVSEYLIYYRNNLFICIASLSLLFFSFARSI